MTGPGRAGLAAALLFGLALAAVPFAHFFLASPHAAPADGGHLH